MKRVELLAGLAFTAGLLVAVGWIGVQLMGGGGTEIVADGDDPGVPPEPAQEPVTPPSLQVDRTENIVQRRSSNDDSAPEEAEIQNPELGSMEGRVVSPDGQPVLGADIELARGPALVMTMPGLRNSTGVTTQTDQDGRFQLYNLPPADDYLVIAMHPDYGDSVAGPIDLELGEVEKLGDIMLATGIKVFGQVNSNGRSIAGALVSLTNTSSGFSLKGEQEEGDDVVLTATTRADGSYSFDTVPVNSFEVTVEAEGYGRQTRSNRSLFSAPQDTQIDFDLDVANTITGLVMDENRHPIAGATVDANLTGEQFRSDSRAVTGEDGRFELKQLNNGFYHLTVQCQDYSSNTKPRIPASTTNLEVTLLRQGTVSGQVIDSRTGDPISAFRVYVLRSIQGREPARTAITKDVQSATGEFEISGLDPNAYLIEARADGYAPCTSEEVRVIRGEVASGVIVPMNRGGTVTGRVVDGRGKAVRNAQVRINPNDFNWNPVHDLMEKMAQTDDFKRQVRSDEDGKFTLDLVIPGTYQVAARHPRYASAAVNNIEVKLDEIHAVGDLILPLGGTVEGHARNTDGTPLVGATINAISKQSDYKQVRCDNDGFFRIAGLRAGEYTVSIASYASNPPENILVQMIKAKNSAQEVTLRDGDQVTVNLQLVEQS